MKNTDLRALLKRTIELVMPDLRAYYRIVRKAKVIKTYASDGRYWADVQPLRNDDSVDPDEPVVPKVEIPVLWGGPERGLVCPPAVGTYCDLSYYDGDPDYPRISNFRWQGHKAPEIEIGGFIIQQEPGTSIRIDSEHNIIRITPADIRNTTGGGKSEEVNGNWTINVGGDVAITASGQASIRAPHISLAGNQTSTGRGGGIGKATERSNKTHTGSLTLEGPLTVIGDITATGVVMDAGGNSNHHSH